MIICIFQPFLTIYVLFLLLSFFHREEKEKFIRAKYEAKEFLCELPLSDFSTGEVSLNLAKKGSCIKDAL